jgi:hypothetical protein
LGGGQRLVGHPPSLAVSACPSGTEAASGPTAAVEVGAGVEVGDHPAQEARRARPEFVGGGGDGQVGDAAAVVGWATAWTATVRRS